MGEIKKFGDEYVIEFFARGLKYQQKAGPDKAKAENLLKDIETKIANGEAGLLVRDIDCDLFLREFLEYSKATYTSKSLFRFQSLINHFQQYLKGQWPEVQKLSQVTPRVVELYKHHLLSLKIKPNIINFSLALLKIILEYGIKLGYINDNSTIHISDVDWGKNKAKSFGDAISLQNGSQSHRRQLALTLTEKNVPLPRMGELLGFRDIARTFCIWSHSKNILTLNRKSP